MMNLNDTISAFRCCTQIPPMCKECPLTEMCKWNLSKDRCKNEVKLSVNHWLQAQEPRVIDFDDVVGGDECWLEAVNGACGYADCYACTGTGEVQVFRCNFDNPQYIMASDYLKTWRCWTSRPTDEQREAIPWES